MLHTNACTSHLKRRVRTTPIHQSTIPISNKASRLKLPIIPHNNSHPVALLHPNSQQPSRHRLNMSVKFLKVPSKMPSHAQILGYRAPMRTGCLAATYQRRPCTMFCENFKGKVFRERVGDQRGVNGTLDRRLGE